MTKPKLKFLLKKSLLKMIENSVGTKMFRNSFYTLGGKDTDILKNGALSCAIYVSSVLHIFKLLTGVHATVEGTTEDMKTSGWKKAKTPQAGDVLVWETSAGHKHIGFYKGYEVAVSNDYRLGYPTEHHWTNGIKNGHPVRKIESIFRLELLSK